MIKGTDIYAAAMALMDRGDAPAEPAGFRRRSTGLINLLQGELYRLTRDCEPAAGNSVPHPLRSLDERTELDGFLALTVLPYGLAAELLSEEDPVHSAQLYARYHELKAEARAGTAAAEEDITDFYGIAEFSELGAWQ